jgi:hypothetical protein
MFRRDADAQNGRTIFSFERTRFDALEFPEEVITVYLDARARAGNVRRWFQHHNIDIINIDIPDPSHCYQLLSGAYGISTLENWQARQTGQNIRYSESFERLMTLTQAIIDKEESEERSALLVSQKRYHAELTRRFPNLNEIIWYHGFRGIDRFGGIDSIILIGAPLISHDEIRRAAFKLNLNEEAVKELYIADEMFQTVHRIRPILRGPESESRYYILTNYPFDLICSYHRFFEYQELMDFVKGIDPIKKHADTINAVVQDIYKLFNNVDEIDKQDLYNSLGQYPRARVRNIIGKMLNKKILKEKKSKRANSSGRGRSRFKLDHRKTKLTIS